MRAALFGTLALAAVACGDEAPPHSSPPPLEAPDDGGGGGLVVDGEGEFEACASTRVEGERIGVQMLIMFDKSGSMLEDQKWAGATAALTAFFQDDDSAGLGVALRFFPDDEPASGCNESACSEAACAAPLVDLGVLNDKPAHSDAHQAALVDAVQSRQPGGQTPMFAALAGAASWAEAHAGDDARTAIVLVTDGEPNGCNEDAGAIAALAGEAASFGVTTYAIGMDGADLSQLDLIAEAGGTGAAVVVGKGTVHKDLVAAFEEIGLAAPACSTPVPDAETLGEDLDPNLVNVTFTRDDGSEVTIPRVDTVAGCDGPGWYYDDPGAPTSIELCPTSCDTVQADKRGQLEVVFGCTTVVR